MRLKNYYKALDLLLKQQIENNNGITWSKSNANLIKILEKDFLLKKDNGKYFITTEGKVFILKGGYLKEYRKESFKTNLQTAFWVSNIANFLISMTILLIFGIRENNSNKRIYLEIEKLEKEIDFLKKENTHINSILKKKAKAWGEIPADFGRK